MLFVFLAMLETAEDKEKMSDLYSTYREYLLNVAQSILHNKDDAEDVLHQTFLRVATNFESIGEVSSRKTRNYLVIIVRGLALNLYKKRGKVVDVPIEDLEGTEFFAVDDPQLELFEYEDLYPVLDELPVIHRDMIYLMYFEGLSVREIAKRIDITERAVQKRIERARQALKNVLEREDWGK